MLEQDESPDVIEQDESLLLEQESRLEDTSNSLTDLDRSTLEIKRQREEAFNCLTNQAKRMKRTSDQYLPQVDKGCTVRIPVPDVDRGRGDSRSVLGIVLDIVDDTFYRLGTRDGVLKPVSYTHLL